ncbi:MAG: hypothetical protein OXG57_07570 [Acidimicrobiaceae bacterium]|nr:hypothetical protein [Acidimicrobiaceae bacterium]MDE0677628.1 hypothetical protein [Acidimicrobiaceae bacterium]
MPVAAIVTIVIALVVAAALAFYLTRVVMVLRSVNDSLGNINFGVRAIAEQTAPLEELLTPIKTDLEAVADVLDGVAASLTETAQAS